MRRITALALCVMMAACGRESTPEAPRKEIRVRSAGQDQLLKLDDFNRAIALKRAIIASGSKCKRLTASGFVGEYKNLDMWTARCEPERDWAIFIGPDDSVQVRLCRDTEKVGLPACKAKPGTEGGDGLATKKSGPA